MPVPLYLSGVVIIFAFLDLGKNIHSQTASYHLKSVINGSHKETKKDQGKPHREDQLAYPAGKIKEQSSPKFHFNFYIACTNEEHCGGYDHTHYRKDEGVFNDIGTYVELQKARFFVSESSQGSEKKYSSLLYFTQTMRPCFKLMIFGAEHDAVQLCKFAALNGWEVTVVAGPMESKTIENFPGATDFYSASPDMLELSKIDDQTAIVLMSHNFANDLKFLIELKDTNPAYLGLLGPAHRREKLLSQLIEYIPDVNEKFIDLIHGPAGLNIGAETPQEIAVSILSEILSVVRNKRPMLLKEKDGGIHA